jgi:hypothetical protein
MRPAARARARPGSAGRGGRRRAGSGGRPGTPVFGAVAILEVCTEVCTRRALPARSSQVSQDKPRAKLRRAIELDWVGQGSSASSATSGSPAFRRTSTTCSLVISSLDISKRWADRPQTADTDPFGF